MQTVHSPLFFSKIVEIKRNALVAAILDECRIYLESRWRAEAAPSVHVHMKLRWLPVPVKAQSWRSYEKIGDHEQPICFNVKDNLFTEDYFKCRLLLFSPNISKWRLVSSSPNTQKTWWLPDRAMIKICWKACRGFVNTSVALWWSLS